MITGPDTLKVSPFSKDSRKEPFYLLYFSEARFSCGGHYQSIVKKNVESDTFTQNVNDRVSIDSQSQPFLPPHHSSKINDMTDDLPSFHTDYLDTTSDSPITFKKPKVLLKRKTPIDISSETASKSSKTSKTKSKSQKSQKSTQSKESINIDECNILKKGRREK